MCICMYVYILYLFIWCATTNRDALRCDWRCVLGPEFDAKLMGALVVYAVFASHRQTVFLAKRICRHPWCARVANAKSSHGFIFSPVAFRVNAFCGRLFTVLRSTCCSTKGSRKKTCIARVFYTWRILDIIYENVAEK